ncbi:MAG: flagellar hook-associated protein FlgL [Azoarcus sp.]|jgi:flagellar hook-associated protein 3 FlgL|nr:flagellar hook-associated protein FlgL [Azoarcus sp.]
MRVSTNMIYDRGVFSIQSLWSSALHANQEVSTGRRVLTPADDPIAAARALDVTQSRSINTQFQTNQDYSNDQLKLLENRLAGVGDILQYVRQSAVSAGDAVLNQEELDFIAVDMRSQFDALLSLANTRDASGDFLFSGYRADMQPFQGSYGNVHYEGDQGMRTMQVSATRFMPVSLPGSSVFDNTRALEGAINTFTGKSNSGGAMATTVFDPAQPDVANVGRRYEVRFNGTGYDVTEYQPGNSSPVTVTPVTVTPGPPDTIEFNGLKMEVSGTPGNGDAFDVFVASKNVFDNLAIFIDTLERPGASGIISGVQFAIGNTDAALDTSLRARAQVGSQMIELEQLSNLSSDMNLQYAETLSRLQDCDYAEAMSRLAQLQTNLEAAQLSFMKVSGLSLFNFLQ